MSVLPPAWGTLYLLSRLDDPTICASPIRYLSRCARGIWGLSGESGDYRGLVTNSVRERVLLRSRGVAQPDRAPVVCCKVLVSTIETLRAGRLRVQVPPPHPIVENKRSPPRPSRRPACPLPSAEFGPMVRRRSRRKRSRALLRSMQSRSGSAAAAPLNASPRAKRRASRSWML